MPTSKSQALKVSVCDVTVVLFRRPLGGFQERALDWDLETQPQVRCHLRATPGLSTSIPLPRISPSSPSLCPCPGQPLTGPSQGHLKSPELTSCLQSPIFSIHPSRNLFKATFGFLIQKRYMSITEKMLNIKK